MVRNEGAKRPDLGAITLATRQHGLVSTAQLRALGLDAKAVRRRVRAARLHPVLPGVLAIGHPRLTEDGRAMAVVLAYHPARAAVSHRSAAARWGLLAPARGRVEVIADVSHQRPGTVRHRLALAPGDVRVRDGIPTTAVGRTLADLASVAPAPIVERAVNAAQTRGLLTGVEIRRALAVASNRRGAQVLRELLGAVEPRQRLRSELERRFLQLVDRAGLPRPATNLLVELEERVHEVDAAWPQQRLAVELDGAAYHSAPGAVRADRERDARFARAGWRTLRFSWWQVTEQPDEVVATLVSRPAAAALLG